MWIRTHGSRFLLACFLVFALFWAGCSQVGQMKEFHQKGEYQKLANMEVSCTPSDEGCNQMHLLKGDACYVLGRRAEGADRDSTARRHFKCADTHLGAGIRQSEAKGSAQWKIAGSDRPQWYLNRAESLRQRQDLLKGDSARAVSERLLEFGQTYREAVPDAAAPYFYVATARYARLQPKLIDVPPGDTAVCDELGAIQTILDEAPVGDASDAIRDNVESLNRQLDNQRERVDCSP